MAKDSSGPQRQRSHIVVFKEGRATRECTSSLQKAAKLSVPKASKQVAGIMELKAERQGMRNAKLYANLSAAAVDLDESQANALREDPSVVRVFPNQRRYPQVVWRSDAPERATAAGSSGGPTYHRMGGSVGPVYAAGGSIGPVFATGGTIGPTYPMGGGVGPMYPASAGTDPYTAAYVQGRHDGMAQALHMFGARGPALAAKSGRARDGSHNWTLDLIGLDRTYDAFTGEDVTVAVLDTGIDLGHADFGTHRLKEGKPTSSTATAVSFVPDESVQDGDGHGTHCAGVVAGPHRPRGGTRYGVAPNVNLLVGKVLSDEGYGYDEWILDGIAWAVDRGARVVSLSLGSPRDSGIAYAMLYERVAHTLFQTGQGTLLVSAAGNESSRPAFVAAVGNPAACPSFMAVAAVDASQHVGWFSCGQRDVIGLVDISGPGVDVLSAVPRLNGEYGRMSGTSMATPHVAGVAALYLEAEPGSTARDLWWLLEQRALPLGASMDYGRGLVQVP